MSKSNKVNKDRYVQRGRLTADELARQQARQIHLSDGHARMAMQRKYSAAPSEPAPRPAERVSSQARNEPEESD